MSTYKYNKYSMNIDKETKSSWFVNLLPWPAAMVLIVGMIVWLLHDKVDSITIDIDINSVCVYKCNN